MRPPTWLRRAAASLILTLPWGPALAQAVAGPQAAPIPPPAEAFFNEPELQQVRLSPSGRYLASLLAMAGRRTVLAITDLEDPQGSQKPAAYSFDNHDMRGLTWVSDQLLIFQVDDDQDRGPDANRRGPGLMSMQRDTGSLRMLIRRRWDNRYPIPGIVALEANHGFIALGAQGTEEIIVGECQCDSKFDRLINVRLLAVNARTGGRRSLVDKPPANVTSWWFDTQARPRLGLSNRDGELVFHWLDLPEGRWRELARAPTLKAPFWPSYIDADGQLFVSWVDPATGVHSVGRLDLATAKPVAEPLITTPGFGNPVQRIADRNTGKLLGVTVTTDDATQVWFDPFMKDMQARADKLLPGRINLLACAPCEKPVSVLVYSYSDQHAGEYLLHFPATGRWQRLGERRPGIRAAQMGVKNLHRIKARDGADLPVWVTQPPGAGPQRLPAVVLVHGGPWLRGAEWGWSADSQFLATRGYVVIEPEFRGSMGYGDAHFRAGWRQWGQAMQDDVSDALRFTVDKGWVDPARVCIAGGSYGGYSTLMGLARHGDQYRCGVAWAAVSDPRLMFSIHWSDISEESKQYEMPLLIGDPTRDAATLSANAPLELAGRIKAPLLLVHGALDRRVPIEHGERKQAALAKAGNPPEWHVYGDEDHGWRRPDNVLDFWRRVDTFLARHLEPGH